MDPLVTASLISAGGSLLGGMLGSGGGHVSGDDYKKAAYRTIEGKIMAANQFGVHPLYALGAATPGPAQVMPGQSKWGSAAKDAVHAISQGILAKQQAQAASAQTDLLKAQTRESEARTNQINKEINSQPNNLTGFRARDLHGKAPPLYVPYFDQMTGKTVMLPNPVANVEMPETVGAYIAGRPYAKESGLFQSGRRHSPTRSRGSRGTRRYSK